MKVISYTARFVYYIAELYKRSVLKELVY